MSRLVGRGGGQEEVMSAGRVGAVVGERARVGVGGGARPPEPAGAVVGVPPITAPRLKVTHI